MSYKRRNKSNFNDTFRFLKEVFDEFEEIFDSSFVEDQKDRLDSHVTKSEDKVVIRVPVPGAGPDDVKVSLSEADGKKTLTLTSNTLFRQVNHRYKVKATVEPDDITVKVKNGLATITILNNVRIRDAAEFVIPVLTE